MRSKEKKLKNFLMLVTRWDIPQYKEEEKMEKKTFEEWKAANCFEIEDLADYFIIHDTENYFVHEKYLEAYEKIESLCKLAFDRE